MHPSFGAIAAIAAHCDGCSGPCSRTSRTARSRTSGEYRVGRAIGSILSTNEPSDNPGTIQGVLREPLDPKTDKGAQEYKRVRAVMDRALADLERLGAVIVDATPIPDLAGRSALLYDDNVFETEAATNQYLAEHVNAPAKTLAEILLSGKVVPARARALANVLGHSTNDLGYSQLLLGREQLRREVLVVMADQRLDALAYATFDYPAPEIPADALTRPTIDLVGPGNNRRLSPVVGFPAITVPAGFTVDGLPVGFELMGRTFSEPVLLTLAFAVPAGDSPSATSGFDAASAKMSAIGDENDDWTRDGFTREMSRRAAPQSAD